MADAVTPHYKLVQPEVGLSQDTWGGKLNEDLTDIDALLKNRLVISASGKDADTVTNPGTGGFIPQEMGLWLKLPTQPNYPVGADPVYFVKDAAATMGWVEYRILSLLDSVFQVGSIILWNGSYQQWIDYMRPHGWYICDGNYGTPNLQDRIVLSMGGYHPPGEYGGDRNPGLGRHTHEVTAYVASGVTGAPEFSDDFGGQAIYAAEHGQTDLPYYALCYLMKIQGFTG